MKKCIKYILLFFFLLIFMILAIKVHNGGLKVDMIIAKRIINIHSKSLTFIMKCITNMGSVLIITLICLLGIIFLKPLKNKITFAINPLCTLLINLALKNLFVRPRPDILKLVNEFDYSFPSGHAMMSTTVYGLLTYLINKSSMPRKIKIFFTIILCILILLICFSRIYLGVHYFSDILAGIAISSAYLIIFISISKIEIK